MDLREASNKINFWKRRRYLHGVFFYNSRLLCSDLYLMYAFMALVDSITSSKRAWELMAFQLRWVLKSARSVDKALQEYEQQPLPPGEVEDK